MPRRIEKPTVVESAGTLPKVIEEYVGRVNTGDAGVSIARMRSPQGWLGFRSSKWHWIYRRNH